MNYAIQDCNFLKNICNWNKWFTVIYTLRLTWDFLSKVLDKWEYPLIAISDDIDNHSADNYNKITEPPKLQTHPAELVLY